MDFISKRRIWYTVSLVVIGLGLLSMLIQGLNLGIDFTGGTILDYKFDEGTNVSIAEIRSILAEHGIDQASTIVKSDDPYNGILIRTVSLQPEVASKIEEQVRAKYPSAEMMKSDQVGPSIGKELRIKAFYALFVASLAIVAYISIRFQFKFAIAAIVALLHDVAIVMAIFSIFRLEINTPFVAAILTIVGYSINDTIVIFDRVRENVKFMRKQPLDVICNKAILDTLPRSINTSLTTLMTVLAILFFGGTSIKVFMVALLVGILSGTYSSIFVAAPLLVTWKKWISREDKKYL